MTAGATGSAARSEREGSSFEPRAVSQLRQSVFGLVIPGGDQRVVADETTGMHLGHVGETPR